MEEHSAENAALLSNVPARTLEYMSDEEFWKYAQERANVASLFPFAEEFRRDQYLECELSCGTCLIPLSYLAEVVPPHQRFALLPLIPDWMPGILVWRGETIAVIDLEQYLCGVKSPTHVSLAEATLLIANHAGLTVGLLLQQSGPVSTASSLGSILDVPALLIDVVQKIGMAANHG